MSTSTSTSTSTAQPQSRPRNIISDHAHFKPPLHRRAAVRAPQHLLRAGGTRALMGARHGKVRLLASHVHTMHVRSPPMEDSGASLRPVMSPAFQFPLARASAPAQEKLPPPRSELAAARHSTHLRNTLRLVMWARESRVAKAYTALLKIK